MYRNILHESICNTDIQYAILNEQYESQPEILSNNRNVTVFRTVLQEAERPNRNGRIYTKKALCEALNRPMILEKLRYKTWFGECGHPFDKSVERQTYLDQTKISHIVISIEWVGNLLYAIVETADTAAGRDFRGLILQGCRASFSMRGLGGDVGKKDGYQYIDSGLFIFCYDNVNFPSHDKAYMEKILKEDSSSYVFNEDAGFFMPDYSKKENKPLTFVSGEELKKIISESNSEYKNKGFLRDNNRYLNQFLENNNRVAIDDFMANL